MNPEATSSPGGEGSRSSLVPLAVAFYAGMGVVAVAWRWLVDGQGPFFAA